MCGKLPLLVPKTGIDTPFIEDWLGVTGDFGLQMKRTGLAGHQAGPSELSSHLVKDERDSFKFSGFYTHTHTEMIMR